MIFYPLLAIVSAGLIAASFGHSLRPLEPAAQAGQATATGLVYGSDALAHIDPGPNQLLYVDRAPFSGAARSVQIGTQRTAGAPAPEKRGAQLRLAKSDAAALGGGPLTVIVAYRPIASNIAPELSLSAQGEGPTVWMKQPVPVTEGTLRFELPATAGPVSAIGFWPHPQGDEFYANYGIEIVAIRVRRAPPAG